MHLPSNSKVYIIYLFIYFILFAISDIDCEYFIQNSLCPIEIVKSVEKKKYDFQLMLNSSSTAKTDRLKFMENTFDSTLCTKMSVSCLMAVKKFKDIF